MLIRCSQCVRVALACTSSAHVNLRTRVPRDRNMVRFALENKLLQEGLPQLKRAHAELPSCTAPAMAFVDEAPALPPLPPGQAAHRGYRLRLGRLQFLEGH